MTTETPELTATGSRCRFGWQMTRREYDATGGVPIPEEECRPHWKAEAEIQQLERELQRLTGYDDLRRVGRSSRKGARALFKRIEEMRHNYRRAGRALEDRYSHAAIVRLALAAGLPVPPEVAAEYEEGHPRVFASVQAAQQACQAEAALRGDA